VWTTSLSGPLRDTGRLAVKAASETLPLLPLRRLTACVLPVAANLLRPHEPCRKETDACRQQCSDEWPDLRSAYANAVERNDAGDEDADADQPKDLDAPACRPTWNVLSLAPPSRPHVQAPVLAVIG
jgi:hypothetical protein